MQIQNQGGRNSTNIAGQFKDGTISGEFWLQQNISTTTNRCIYMKPHIWNTKKSLIPLNPLTQCRCSSWKWANMTSRGGGWLSYGLLNIILPSSNINHLGQSNAATWCNISIVKHWYHRLVVLIWYRVVLSSLSDGPIGAAILPDICLLGMLTSSCV